MIFYSRNGIQKAKDLRDCVGSLDEPEKAHLERGMGYKKSLPGTTGQADLVDFLKCYSFSRHFPSASSGCWSGRKREWHQDRSHNPGKD